VLARATSNLIDRLTELVSRGSEVDNHESESGVGGHQSTVLSCIRRSYRATTSEGTVDLTFALVIFRVCRSVKVLQLFVAMSYKRSVNPSINPDPVFSY
jgi:hypothetical protein